MKPKWKIYWNQQVANFLLLFWFVFPFISLYYSYNGFQVKGLVSNFVKSPAVFFRSIIKWIKKIKKSSSVKHDITFYFKLFTY